MSSRRSLHRQAMLVAASSGVAQVVLAIVYAVAARLAGPSSFGAVAAAFAVATGVAGFLDFGSNALWVREVASRRSTMASIASRFVWKSATAVLVGGVGAIVLVTTGSPGTWLLAVAYGAGVVVNQASAVFLRADHRSERIAFALLSERALDLTIFGATVALGLEPILALAVALAAGTWLSVGILWYATPAAIRPRLESAKSITNPWRGSMGFAAANAATSLAALDTAVIQAVAGNSAAGTYAAVSRWTQPMSLLSSSVSSTASPFLASAANGRAALEALRGALWLLVVATLGGAAVIVLAPWIVPAILGTAFTDSIGVLQLLALGSMLTVWNQPAAVLLQARNRDRAVGAIRLAGTGVFLACVAVLAPPLGPLGAALGYVILQVVIAISFATAALGIVRTSGRGCSPGSSGGRGEVKHPGFGGGSDSPRG